MSSIRVQVKRIYEKPAAGDGLRILVDRLWPRGVSRERAKLDEWNRDIAPSSELRSWFAHRPEHFDEFRLAYLEELRQQRGGLKALRSSARNGPVTLLYAAHDTEHNHAIVLAEVLRNGIPKRRGLSASSDAHQESRAK